MSDFFINIIKGEGNPINSHSHSIPCDGVALAMTFPELHGLVTCPERCPTAKRVLQFILLSCFVDS